jgi:hypothetical protein
LICVTEDVIVSVLVLVSNSNVLPPAPSSAASVIEAITSVELIVPNENTVAPAGAAARRSPTTPRVPSRLAIMMPLSAL